MVNGASKLQTNPLFFFFCQMCIVRCVSPTVTDQKSGHWSAWQRLRLKKAWNWNDNSSCRIDFPSARVAVSGGHQPMTGELLTALWELCIERLSRALAAVQGQASPGYTAGLSVLTIDRADRFTLDSAGLVYILNINIFRYLATFHRTSADRLF